MPVVASGRLASLVLALCVAALPWAPAAHVHETDEHGHHELVVHSHSEAHHAHELHSPPDHATLDDVDSVVLTLDPVFAATPSYVATSPAVTVTALLLEPPPPNRASTPAFVAPLIHRPPRAPAVLRGPPLSSRL